MDLLTVDADMLRRCDSDANSVAASRKHRYANVVVNHNLFANAPCEYQHGHPSSIQVCTSPSSIQSPIDLDLCPLTISIAERLTENPCQKSESRGRPRLASPPKICGPTWTASNTRSPSDEASKLLPPTFRQ
jgi:hypothetical protein